MIIQLELRCFEKTTLILTDDEGTQYLFEGETYQRWLREGGKDYAKRTTKSDPSPRGEKRNDGRVKWGRISGKRL
jgi:hypothetical protein